MNSIAYLLTVRAKSQRKTASNIKMNSTAVDVSKELKTCIADLQLCDLQLCDLQLCDLLCTFQAEHAAMQAEQAEHAAMQAEQAEQAEHAAMQAEQAEHAAMQAEHAAMQAEQASMQAARAEKKAERVAQAEKDLQASILTLNVMKRHLEAVEDGVKMANKLIKQEQHAGQPVDLTCLSQQLDMRGFAIQNIAKANARVLRAQEYVDKVTSHEGLSTIFRTLSF